MLENDGNLMDMTIQDSKKDLVRSLMSYSSLGIEMGLSVAIGIAIGYFLDRFFKTSPYLTIIFMIFGVAAISGIVNDWPPCRTVTVREPSFSRRSSPASKRAAFFAVCSRKSPPPSLFRAAAKRNAT